MYVCMCVCMYVKTGGWVDGWMDGWMYYNALQGQKYKATGMHELCSVSHFGSKQLGNVELLGW